MGARIDAVLFDFDHTLGIDHRLEETVLHDLSSRLCASPLSGARVVETLALFRSGGASLPATLQAAFDGCACGDGIVERYKTAVLALLPEHLEPMPGAPTALRALQEAGLIVGILSNGWTELQRAKAAGIGFDGPVIVSEAIDAWKPDQRAFEVAARTVGARLDRTVYVGDSPFTDVAGARSAGMVAVWADLEGAIYPAALERPDHKITALDQLPGLIGRLRG